MPTPAARIMCKKSHARHRSFRLKGPRARGHVRVMRRLLGVLLLLAACGSRSALDDRADDSGVVPADAHAIEDATPSSDASDARPDVTPPRDAGCTPAPLLLSEDGALQRLDTTTLAVTTVATIQCSAAGWYALAQRPDGALFAAAFDGGGVLTQIGADGRCAPIPMSGFGGFQQFWTVAPAFVGDAGSGTPAWFAVHSWADGNHGFWRTTNLVTVSAVPGLDRAGGRCKLAGTTNGHLYALCLRDGGVHALMELAPSTPASVIGSVTTLPGVTALFGVEALATDGVHAWVFTASQFASSSRLQQVDLGSRAVTELGAVPSRVVGAVWAPRCP